MSDEKTFPNRLGRVQADIFGLKFGRLTTVSYLRGVGKTKGQWNCKCDCGQSCNVQTANLKSGKTKSCGCLVVETCAKLNFKHGHARTNNNSKTWQCWASMIARCGNSRRSDYYLYGGRGIFVTKRWLTFKNFLRDMGENPAGRSIGRKDNNKGYSKRNCRWETPEMQGGNKRNNHFITVNGETMIVSAWARRLEANPDIVFTRLKRGWSDYEAVTTPLGKRR